MQGGLIGSTRKRQGLGVVVAALVVLAAFVATAGALTNGGFEKGLKHWKTAGAEPGINWKSYKHGSSEPLPEMRRRGLSLTLKLPDPKRGKRAAGFVSGGPQTRILLRSVRIPDSQSKLKFLLSFASAAKYHSPNTLKAGGKPNQQLRIDLLRPSAKPRSMRSADILKTVFHTRKSSPDRQRWKRIKSPIPAKLQGRRVILRFAEVDNRGPFMAAVDQVSFKRKR